MPMHKPYKCPVCGAEVPDQPMPVLKHQLSHVTRRPRAQDRPRRERERPKHKPNEQPADQIWQLCVPNVRLDSTDDGGRQEAVVL